MKKNATHDRLHTIYDLNASKTLDHSRLTTVYDMKPAQLDVTPQQHERRQKRAAQRQDNAPSLFHEGISEALPVSKKLTLRSPEK